MSQQKIVLFGDSILDNASYAAPEPDTVECLRRLLGARWSVDLVAQDGSIMLDMPSQLQQVPDCAATAILSVGGNDLLEHIDLLRQSNTKISELINIADEFTQHYKDVVRSFSTRFDRLILCTIYEVQLDPAPLTQLVRAPLGIINDQIIRTAACLGLEVLELRDFCTEPSDFVLQIEPSASGAAKIASAIAALLRQEPSMNMGRIYSGLAEH